MTCRWHVRAATWPARRRGVPYGSPKIGKLLRELADFYFFTLHFVNRRRLQQPLGIYSHNPVVYLPHTLL